MPLPEKHDLVVIGAGPAGLSAAYTAEFHHIDTLILDDNGALGGQVANAAHVENYAGFPEGISGRDLVGRLVEQALKFETEFIAPTRAVEVAAHEEGIVVTTDDKEKLIGKTALLATGVEPRRLKVRNLAAYLGRGVAYGPPHPSAMYPEDHELFIVGGSDGAGQAAVDLAKKTGANVHMLVRGQKLDGRMSGYLIEQVLGLKNIQVHTGAQLESVNGNSKLESVSIAQRGDTHLMDADRVFILIGGVPKTFWLPDSVERDSRGYVKSGNDISPEGAAAFAEQTKGRKPFAHETSLPGLFVAGDVRSGTEKWAPLATADGISVVPELHRLRIHNNLKRR